MTGEHWFAALFYLDRIISPEEKSLDKWLTRGYVRAELGQWRGAAEDFARSVALGNTADETQSWLALVCRAANDADGARRARSFLLQRFAEIENPAEANLVAWTCLLAGAEGDELKTIKRLAERAVAAQPTNHAFSNTLGGVLCRLDEWDAALKCLEGSIKQHGNGGEPADWIFLAIAHQGLGHEQEARRRLQEATQWIEKATNPGAGRPAPALRWTQRLELQLLLRDAREKLGDKAP